MFPSILTMFQDSVVKEKKRVDEYLYCMNRRQIISTPLDQQIDLPPKSTLFGSREFDVFKSTKKIIHDNR